MNLWDMYAEFRDFHSISQRNSDQLVQNITSGELNLLLRALLRGEVQEFERRLTELVEKMISYHDNAESFYHGFVLGITALLVGSYQVVSNRESGYGRFDLAIFPLEEKRGL